MKAQAASVRGAPPPCPGAAPRGQLCSDPTPGAPPRARGSQATPLQGPRVPERHAEGP